MGKLYARKLNISKAFAVMLCLLLLFAEAIPAFASDEVTISVPVRIEITGADDGTADAGSSAGTVTVTMTPQDGAPAPRETAITVTGAGTGTFEGLTYTEPGDYVYTVRMSGTSEDVVYDTAVYTVTVRVTNSDGSLTADYWAVKNDSTGKSDEIVFSNAITDASAYYIVEHYLEQLNGTYKLADSYTYTAKAGDTVTAIPNSYEHYTENTSHPDRIGTGVVFQPVTAATISITSAEKVSDDVALITSVTKADAAVAMNLSATTSGTAADSVGIVATANTASQTDEVLTLRLYYDLDRYTITYVDGVDGSVIFEDQIYPDQPYGIETPVFVGTPTRDGYTFMGWNPTVEDTVTGDMIYTAVWEPVAENSSLEESISSTPSDNDNSSTGLHIKTGDVKWFVMWGCAALFLCGWGLIVLAGRREKKQD